MFILLILTLPNILCTLCDLVIVNTMFILLTLPLPYVQVVSSNDDGCKVVDLMLPPNGPWISSHLLDTGMCTNAAG